MDLLEYQGKQIFAEHGVPVPEGKHAATPEEARAAAESLGFPVVVKAQVQIGGRGKAGGIKIAADADEAEAHAEQHCPVGGDLFGLCPFDRRQPVHRRTESQRLDWAQHRIAHPARVAVYHLLADLRMRLPPGPDGS